MMKLEQGLAGDWAGVEVSSNMHRCLFVNIRGINMYRKAPTSAETSEQQVLAAQELPALLHKLLRRRRLRKALRHARRVLCFLTALPDWCSSFQEAFGKTLLGFCSRRGCSKSTPSHTENRKQAFSQTSAKAHHAHQLCSIPETQHARASLPIFLEDSYSLPRACNCDIPARAEIRKGAHFWKAFDGTGRKKYSKPSSMHPDATLSAKSTASRGQTSQSHF